MVRKIWDIQDTELSRWRAATVTEANTVLDQNPDQSPFQPFGGRRIPQNATDVRIYSTLDTKSGLRVDHAVSWNYKKPLAHPAVVSWPATGSSVPRMVCYTISGDIDNDEPGTTPSFHPIHIVAADPAVSPAPPLRPVCCDMFSPEHVRLARKSALGTTPSKAATVKYDLSDA